MKRLLLSVGVAVLCGVSAAPAAEPVIYRLYDDLGAFVNNPDGKDFTITLDVRDINRVGRGPGELLVKVYDPDGRAVVREVIPDDGVNALGTGPTLAGWDHESWYYETCYSRGLDPVVTWSSASAPSRLAHTPKRTFTYAIKGGGKGVYRVILAGSPDHYVSLALDPVLSFGVNGGPDWAHGHHDVFNRSYVYVPKGTDGIGLGILELDQPRGRRATLKSPDGKPVILKQVSRARTGEVLKEAPLTMSVEGRDGYATIAGEFEKPGQYDDQVLVLEVSSGPGDYFLSLDILMPKEQRNWRGQPRVPAVLCPDEATARAVRNGAIYHDGQVFWQMNQVRLWDWLKTLRPEDLKMPADLAVKPGFISVGSHQSPMQFLKNAQLKDPKPGTADIVMHSYDLHRNRQALNVAIQEMLEGMRIIGPNDHVMHGRNLAYEMGCYSYFYHRPAWRILQQSDAPEEAKGPIREFAMQIGDRMPFCRGIELVNGNSLSSLVEGMRYIVEATGDPLHRELFDTYWTRYTTGGFGDRVGVGPSGGVQEGYGYDHHYGAYVLSGWRAVLADLADPRFQKVYNGVLNLYSYVSSIGDNAAPWGSRTHIKPTRYDAWTEGPYRWKGVGGPDFTESVNNANEFFVARRAAYYVVTYHGRTTPTWLGEGFHGQIGFSGGVLCQLHVPGKGQVLASVLSGDYGGGMHPAQWRRFHIHSLVGETADGQPLVTANSEHLNARLDGNVVTSSGEVRQSSVACTRSYTFGGDDIVCSVRLRESSADRVFGIYGGAHGLRGQIREAYEMIPFTKLTTPAGRGKPPVVKTSVTAVDGQGKTIGVLAARPVTAAAVVVDQGGYGVRIELDQPRPVQLGENNTVLIGLVRRATPDATTESAGASASAAETEPASDGEAEGGSAASGGGAVPAGAVSLSYRLIPFTSGPPEGAVQPPGAGSATVARPPVQPATPAPERKLAVLPALAGVGAVAAALEGVEPVSVGSGSARIAEVRVGLSGASLAVDLRVRDPKPAPAEVAWKGSCVEVFGSVPGGASLGQIFLVPGSGAGAAKAYRAKGSQQAPAPEVAVASQAADGGYRMQALIPLPLLSATADAASLLLEFQVSVPVPGGKGAGAFAHVSAFGSTRAYMDTSRYAVFRPARP